MSLIFENGIKFIFLLLLTGVFSRISNRQYQDRISQSQSNRYHREEDVSDFDQYYHNQLQIQLDPEQNERYQSHRGHSHRYQQQNQQNNRAQGYSDQNFLSRLLNSNKKSIVVLVSQDNNELRDSPVIMPVANEVTSAELFIPAQPDAPSTGSLPSDDAYVLYNVLRATQQDEDLDLQAYDQFEKTKDLLRSAFALRCGQRAACEKKCDAKPQCENKCQKVEKVVKKECKRECPETPRQCERKCEKIVEKKVDECEKKVDECEVKEEVKCESKCQQEHDELEACPKPKKTCGPKCGGRTMPPKWLLRFL